MFRGPACGPGGMDFAVLTADGRRITVATRRAAGTNLIPTRIAAETKAATITATKTRTPRVMRMLSQV
jgi:hypothetical protein